MVTGVVRPITHGQEISHQAWVVRWSHSHASWVVRPSVRLSYGPWSMGSCQLAWPMTHGEKVAERCGGGGWACPLPTTDKSGMVVSVFWPGSILFYPIGQTSAVDLTDTLTPEEPANVLLLGCGDPRNILFTVHSQRHDSESTVVSRCNT